MLKLFLLRKVCGYFYGHMVLRPYLKSFCVFVDILGLFYVRGDVCLFVVCYKVCFMVNYFMVLDRVCFVDVS